MHIHVYINKYIHAFIYTCIHIHICKPAGVFAGVPAAQTSSSGGRISGHTAHQVARPLLHLCCSHGGGPHLCPARGGPSGRQSHDQIQMDWAPQCGPQVNLRVDTHTYAFYICVTNSMMTVHMCTMMMMYTWT